MSQKTNPISLRLQKTNKRFESCWYTDVFYKEMSIHDLRIRSYIEKVFGQTGNSQPFLSVQSQYKKTNISMFVFDARGGRVEKEQLLRLPKHKSNSSFLPKKGERAFALPVSQYHRKSHHFPLPFWAKNSLDWFSIFNRISRAAPSFMQTSTIKFKNLSRTASIIPSSISSGSSPMHQLAYNYHLRHVTLLRRFSNKQRVKCVVPMTTMGYGIPICIPASSYLETHNEMLSAIDHTAVYDKNEYRLNEERRDTNPFNALKGKQICTVFQEKLSTILNRESSVFSTFCAIRVPLEIQNASMLIGEIVYLLQRRVAFRQIKDQILRNTSESAIIKGIRLACSGRLGGRSKKAQKAKTQSVQWGETSLHVFSSKLSFASRSANTPFGKVGVKLWICYK